MEQQKPISMKSLSKKSIIMTMLICSIIAVIIGASGMYIYDLSNTPDEVVTKKITLNEVIIAYAPETRGIIFLDRKTGKVQFSLSDTVSFAIYSIISKEIVADYTSKVTSKTKVTP